MHRTAYIIPKNGITDIQSQMISVNWNQNQTK
jgi:hypothetical protein